MRVSAPGGHSSVPPDHTVSCSFLHNRFRTPNRDSFPQTIGILAALIVELEAHPYTPHLYRNDVYYTNLQCQAAYDPDLDTDFRALIARSLTSDKALSELEDKIFKSSLQIKAMGSTTQATDIIHGGVKVNALPEEAFAVVNHRIATYRYGLTMCDCYYDIETLRQFRLRGEGPHCRNVASSCKKIGSFA